MRRQDFVGHPPVREGARNQESRPGRRLRHQVLKYFPVSAPLGNLLG